MAVHRDQLDLLSEPEGRTSGNPQSTSSGRPFLGVHFACCDVYNRIYINREQTAYVGRCPRCGGLVRFAVGPGGTTARLFRAE